MLALLRIMEDRLAELSDTLDDMEGRIPSSITSDYALMVKTRGDMVAGYRLAVNDMKRFLNDEIDKMAEHYGENGEKTD